MKKNRKYKKIKIIMVFTTVLLIAFVAVVGLYKTGIYRFDFFKDVYKKIDFQLSTNELNRVNIYFTREIANCPQ